MPPINNLLLNSKQSRSNRMKGQKHKNKDIALGGGLADKGAGHKRDTVRS